MSGELMSWAEQEAKENIRFRLHISELLAKSAETTLVMVFAGMGGAMAYVVHHADHLTAWHVVGAVAVAAWLMAAACILVLFCMMAMDLPVPANEPKNLYQTDYDTVALRKVELENVQERIDAVKYRNQYIAGWLNRARLMAVATPVVFIVVSVLAAAC